MNAKFVNPTYGSKALENETNATHNGENVFCPVNAYGDCPYCDQCNLCHIADPLEDCDDFGIFFESWEDWTNLDSEPYNYNMDEKFTAEFESYAGGWGDYAGFAYSGDDCVTPEHD